MSTDDSGDVSSLPSPPSPVTASDAVLIASIAQMSAEFQHMAMTSRRGKIISYLLDMVRLEVERSTKKGPH